MSLKEKRQYLLDLKKNRIWGYKEKDLKAALLEDNRKCRRAITDVLTRLRKHGIEDQIIMDVSVRLSAYQVLEKEDIFGSFRELCRVD